MLEQKEIMYRSSGLFVQKSEYFNNVFINVFMVQRFEMPRNNKYCHCSAARQSLLQLFLTRLAAISRGLYSRDHEIPPN